MQSVINQLHDLFALKDLGDIHLFLGIEATRDGIWLFLTQMKYTEELLKKSNMHSTKPCPTPAIIGNNLTVEGREELIDPTSYWKMIGSLQYLTHTRPDISYIVNKCNKFMQTPTDFHMKALKRVLWYLKRTIDVGLPIKPSNRLNMVGYSDSVWACLKDIRRSTSGYRVYLGENLVYWSSKKQNVVLRSSAESEYRALAHLSCEITWLESLLKEINIVIPQTSIV